MTRIQALKITAQVSNGNARLDFAKIENRSLYRALDRKINSLIKRGCWRTAFEFARLLLQLDPYADPYGALLFIDFLAPKAKQGPWLANLLRELPELVLDDADALRLTTYPGLAFASALSMFEGEAQVL